MLVNFFQRRQQQRLALHPDTIDYRRRIISNGGQISVTDILGIDKFVRGIYSNGLRSLILDCLPLAGNNLNAALTKLWFPVGVQSSCTNNNFIETDYSRNTGLKGDANKSLNTGLNPVTQGITTSSFSCGVYNRSNIAENSQEISARESAGNSGTRLMVKFGNGISYYDSFDSAAGRVQVTAPADCRGFVVGSRINLNDSRIYFNASQAVLSMLSGGTVPNLPIHYYCLNSNGNLSQFSSKEMGFFFLGLGLSAAQVATLNTLVQNLMVAFGRAV